MHSLSFTIAPSTVTGFRGPWGSEATRPHAPVVESPGARWISASPLRKAFGGQVIGSTARLRLSTSGSGSPVNSIT